MATVHIEFDNGTVVTYDSVDDDWIEDIAMDTLSRFYPYSIRA